MSEMQVSAIAPWFGSKRTLAPVIVAEIGEHHTWFEPFCGSLAVTLAKPKVRMECANDLHGDLTNLARCIQHHQLGPALYRQCRRMWAAETMFREAAERCKARGRTPASDEPDLERAIDFFYTSWVGRNGVTGTQSYNQGFAARYTPGGGHGGTRWQSAVASIPAWRRRMQDLTILNRCGFGLIEKLSDEPGVAVYCDPPYIVKGAEYVHDFESADHDRLAGLLRRFRRARVVVSYYAHERLAKLYPGWTVVECPTTKCMVCGNGRGKGTVVAPEVLLINGPSFTAESGALFT